MGGHSNAITPNDGTGLGCKGGFAVLTNWRKCQAPYLWPSGLYDVWSYGHTTTRGFNGQIELMKKSGVPPT